MDFKEKISHKELKGNTRHWALHYDIYRLFKKVDDREKLFKKFKKMLAVIPDGSTRDALVFFYRIRRDEIAGDLNWDLIESTITEEINLLTEEFKRGGDPFDTMGVGIMRYWNQLVEELETDIRNFYRDKQSYKDNHYPTPNTWKRPKDDYSVEVEDKKRIGFFIRYGDSSGRKLLTPQSVDEWDRMDLWVSLYASDFSDPESKWWGDTELASSTTDLTLERMVGEITRLAKSTGKLGEFLGEALKRDGGFDTMNVGVNAKKAKFDGFKILQFIESFGEEGVGLTNIQHYIWTELEGKPEEEFWEKEKKWRTTYSGPEGTRGVWEPGSSRKTRGHWNTYLYGSGGSYNRIFNPKKKKGGEGLLNRFCRNVGGKWVLERYPRPGENLYYWED